MSPQVSAGDAAPDFALPPAPGPDLWTLSEHRGTTVVILFFPLAFSGVCTEEMCGLAENWSQWEELGATVVGISVDSPFVTARFAQETGVAFPILSDFNREASTDYGVLYPEFFGLKGVSKRSVFVVDGAGKVAYAWVTEDADVLPPFETVRRAVAEAEAG